MESGRRKSKRIALIVQYDGTDFCGWQIQKKGRTVQAEIESALKVLAGEDIRVCASGRTDSGVHATGQVIHFNLTKEIKLQRLCLGLNGVLPRDISIKNAYRVNNDFHSRYSAIERVYKYIIHNYPLRTPFIKHRSMWVKEKLDLEYLKKVSEFLPEKGILLLFVKKNHLI